MDVHIPVMSEEVLKFLLTDPDGIYVDCTVGGGGHAEKILERLGPRGKLIGIDWDEKTIQVAREKLKKYQDKFLLINDNFINLERVVQQFGDQSVNGVLFDLGISSMQLSSPERGFSFRFTGPLDMRMNQDEKLTAREIINESTEEELYQIFHSCGEERWSGRIARAVVKGRERKPFETTIDLVNLLFRILPKQALRQRIHPATRIFQALRITVNQELENLHKGLEAAGRILKGNNQGNGGRLVVISYHSLEDRIVKFFFRENNFNPNSAIAKFALRAAPTKWCGVNPAHKIVCGTSVHFLHSNAKNGFKILTPKPLRATREEVKMNPRARSAKLRAGEKTKSLVDEKSREDLVPIRETSSLYEK